MEPSDALHTLDTFRHSFYRCFHRRADALFELTDALLTADTVPSPVHLSLEALHRRGWGGLYAALDRGQIDAEALRGLLVRHPLAGSGTTTPVYAVDVSVWDRCDAEASPERGFYYHPSRHSAGQPIVVGTLASVEVERLPRGERRREPRVLWLWWHGPEGETPNLSLLWRAYVRRFDLEHTFRFLKQALGWTTPRVRHPEQADRWTWLVMAAFTQLRLARGCVADRRLPWERRYDTGRLTPIRVHRVVSALLAQLGTPAKPPKPCGRSPGRPKGRLSGRAKRYPALKKVA